MHGLIHYGAELVLVVVTAVLFTFFILHRPGANQTPSRKTIIGLLILGAMIGVVFVTTQSLYVPPPTV